MAGPLQAGGHDVDPVFFFVSDEVLLSEDTIDELCVAEGDFGSWFLRLTLKAEVRERLNEYSADHVEGWLILVAREKVILKARIREAHSSQLPIILLSAETSEEISELLRTSFGIDEPQICAEEE
jgi:preprotein translocase subunit SecD